MIAALAAVFALAAPGVASAATTSSTPITFGVQNTSMIVTVSSTSSTSLNSVSWGDVSWGDCLC